MTDSDLFEIWRAEEADFNLKGWDFSKISGRWDCPDSPWDYRMIVKSYLRDDDILLDMGTGGGEVLLKIGHPYKNTFVTEAYIPNLELCKKRLSPLGITVSQTLAGDKLPFDDMSFDFIINRHESFDPLEVSRTLKRGGYFFTQQVGNENFSELELILNDEGDTHSPDHTIDKYENALKQYGFKTLIRDESKTPAKFFDIGAVIFYSLACPWNIPDFSVKTHFDKLCKIQKEIDEKGCFQVTAHHFLLAERKAGHAEA